MRPVSELPELPAQRISATSSEKSCCEVLCTIAQQHVSHLIFDIMTLPHPDMSSTRRTPKLFTGGLADHSHEIKFLLEVFSLPFLWAKCHGKEVLQPPIGGAPAANSIFLAKSNKSMPTFRGRDLVITTKATTFKLFEARFLLKQNLLCTATWTMTSPLQLLTVILRD